MKIYSVLALAGAVLLALPAFAAHENDQFARVRLQGIMHSDDNGRNARVEVNGHSFDLNLGGSRDLQRDADRFDNQVVLVTGELNVSDGGRRDAPKFVVRVDRIDRGAVTHSDDANYRRERVVDRPVVREKVYVERDQPIIKLPFIEIND